ncbi:hypothetical protein CH275_16425 [Rhodococcus sp. 06-235-1A]|uniref:mycothiol-dependent nitroreductase Rv2466c family protein n=1 Tax=Rhodococcus sp. 06-235-1A TaxID=2022508 RepID=UPI000B9B7D38|nr:hypothetical protein [Rhodococcus sp. 06-235-1A]OZD03363.1 hypothetical protein CH275_16425 [Rhodococcus sp. 06-235-1A]
MLHLMNQSAPATNCDSHHDGLDRIDSEAGTPVLAITTPQGNQRAFFGPVLSNAIDRDDAILLWEALLRLLSVHAFQELKG